MTNFGNLELKKEGLAIFHEEEKRFPNRYKTQFWGIIHALTRRILDEGCCEREAIEKLIAIIENLLDGVRQGKCGYDDLSYPGQVYVDILFIYAPDLDDYFDGNLLGVVENLESIKTDDHNNIERITNMFGSFKKKVEEYGFTSN